MITKVGLNHEMNKITRHMLWEIKDKASGKVLRTGESDVVRTEYQDGHTLVEHESIHLNAGELFCFMIPDDPVLIPA